MAPRLTVRLARGKDQAPVGAAWRDTFIAVAGSRYLELFTGAGISATTTASGFQLPLDEVLGDFPIALLERTR